MTDGEIVREYRMSTNKKKQIKILAELNLTTVKDIIAKIEASGEPVVTDARYYDKTPIPIAVYCAVMERIAKLRKMDDDTVDLYGDIVSEITVLKQWLTGVEVKR